MKLNIFYFKKNKRLESSRVRKIVHTVLESECKYFSKINIVIADDRYMTRLNRVFFNKKKPTNVISFNMGDDCEIYIAQKQIIKELDAYYYIVHGLLHAVGYDHLTRRDGLLMDRKCWEYLSLMNLRE